MAFNNVPANGWPQLKDLEKLNAIASQIENLPTFTSDDRAFLEDLPAYPETDGTKMLTATTSEGNTTLSYDDIPIASPETLGGIMTGEGLFTNPETGETEVNIRPNGGLMFDQDGKLYATVDYSVNNYNVTAANQTRIGNYISGSDVYPIYRRCFPLNQSIAADTTGVNLVNINNYSITGSHVMRVVLRSSAGDVTSSFIYDCSGYFLAIRKNLANTAITITQAIIEYY